MPSDIIIVFGIGVLTGAALLASGMLIFKLINKYVWF